ncbi:hypothetical protein [Mariprofundus sp. EBB-1]|uniref:hypothetical protein n=1 Tax=Mariprofundus sp. EBB-1 TaxID=2650971 RepID=UPI00137B282F|nr:hypothetical protein [Mariprofundus sp. EBB-1]
MRKCFSLFIVATLLFVSSVPMMGEAATCEIPVSANMQVEQVDHDAVQYQGVVKMAAYLPLNRMECGCGCHRTIDALPHLLAPYAFSIDRHKTDRSVVTHAVRLPVVLIARAIQVQVPPPRV